MNNMNKSRSETESMRQLKHLLDRFGLSDWWTILTTWLPNYDGWLAVMEANDDIGFLVDDSPAMEIAELLQRFPSLTLIEDIHFATEISQLGFLCRRAKLVRSGKRWNSFEQSFATFCAIEPDDIPHVFEYTPDSGSVTKYWLLGRLYELRAERVMGTRLRSNGGLAAPSHT